MKNLRGVLLAVAILGVLAQMPEAPAFRDAPMPYSATEMLAADPSIDPAAYGTQDEPKKESWWDRWKKKRDAEKAKQPKIKVSPGTQRIMDRQKKIQEEYAKRQTPKKRRSILPW